MSQDVVTGTGTEAVTPLPSSIDIDAEISALEARLASLLAEREARAVADTEPWVLDHSDDGWRGSPAVGATAFDRRIRQVGPLTAEDEVVLARERIRQIEKKALDALRELFDDGGTQRRMDDLRRAVE